MIKWHPDHYREAIANRRLGSHHKPQTVNLKLLAWKSINIRITQRTTRKRGEYFLEFLMIFFAVFLGFVAENIRERSVEHHHEKEYMQSLVNDLQQDLENIETGLEEKRQGLAFGDSLTAGLSNDAKFPTRTLYYYARSYSTFKNNFYMTDGTLNQLINSGSLRLIRSRQLVDSLQSYANAYHQFELDQELEGDQLKDYRNALTKIFDARIFNSMVRAYPEIKIPDEDPPWLTTDKALVKDLLMRVNFVKRNKLANALHLEKLNRKAKALIKQIKEQYHLD